MVFRQTISELRVRLTAQTEGFGLKLAQAERQMAQLGKRADRLGTRFGALRNRIFNVRNAIGAFIGGTLLRGITNLAQSGARLDSLRGSFTRLAGGIGENSQDILTALQNASAGTISTSELIINANRAMALGVAGSTQDFTDLMEIARLRARDLGLTTTQAFNDIVTGIGRASPLILDNLGIVIKQTEAQERYAESLGKTTAELTENEKREALKYAVLEQGRKQVEEVGELTLNYNERLQTVSASLTNLKDNIGLSLLPAFASLIQDTNIANTGFLQTTDQINALGRVFYRIGQAVLGFGRLIRVTFNGASQFVGVFGSTLLKFAEISTRAFNFDGVADRIGELGDRFQNFADVNYDQATRGADEAFSAIAQAFNPTNYEGLNNEQLANQIQRGATDPINNLGEQARLATEDIKSLEEQVQSFKDEQETLNTDLGKTYDSFSTSVANNAQETINGLAEIVVNAEKAIEELRERRAGATGEARREINDELREQRAIVRNFGDFQEREAERVAGLRTRLEEAGIDATRAGLDEILKASSIEAEVKEQQRIADLNEFERFEDEQVRKREQLVDSLVEEITLLNGKIEQQRLLEQETTDFLVSQNEIRAESTRQYTDDAITQINKVSDSLREAVAIQQELRGDTRTGTGSGGGVQGVENANRGITNSLVSNLVSSFLRVSPLTRDFAGVVNNANRTINAPINVNAQVNEGVDIDAVARALKFELEQNL